MIPNRKRLLLLNIFYPTVHVNIKKKKTSSNFRCNWMNTQNGCLELEYIYNVLREICIRTKAPHRLI